MKKLVSFVAAMLLTAAQAATFLAVPEQGVTITVDNKAACSAASAARVAALKPDASFTWFAAKVDAKGTVYVACATEYNGAVYLVYEDGDMGVIPSNMFHLVNNT